MKTKSFLPGIVLFIGSLLQIQASEPLDGFDKFILIDPEQRYQTIEGWGSSLCWWAAQVGNWDEKKVDEIVDLITSPDKLNMNIFRYNIGGGDDPSHADGHMVKGKGKRAEMEGFKASPTAPYDWTADKGQRTILLKIKEKRPDAIFEAFSNSAPYWMTYSGCAAGNVNPQEDNLKPEYYEMFCDYLLEVCKHYKSAYDIDFKTLEPFNESYSNYWYAQGSQEGCHFDPESQIKIIRMLYPKLKQSGLTTVLSASDETNLEQFLIVQKAYQAAGDIWDKLGQLNTHTYSGTDAQRKEVCELIQKSEKPFWQSETGPSEGNGFDSNLLLAQKLFDDMRIMRPQAWLDWQLMEENNDVWCILRGNFKTQKYESVKNLYVRMQITRFFKQGYTCIETGNKQTFAAISPSGKELVIAVLNTTNEANHRLINLNKFKQKIRHIDNWRTSKTEDCAKLPAIRAKEKTITYTSPAKSLTTFVVNMY
ncbi:glycoside hydrolase [Parabacteroides sp. AM08-6]|uniref:glycoside hydrolase family 30 protein n=1 Tax=Parabacteroides sp. AM08-6 TaxID=2292053 RepID=UPI000F007204|nr:glycoside hydrolase [Parabacteroides sp. AM08-6]RHJ85360.1 glycoside hydrolase [Parabacteroides sp. AM08-6]